MSFWGDDDDDSTNFIPFLKKYFTFCWENDSNNDSQCISFVFSVINSKLCTSDLTLFFAM